MKRIACEKDFNTVLSKYEKSKLLSPKGGKEKKDKRKRKTEKKKKKTKRERERECTNKTKTTARMNEVGICHHVKTEVRVDGAALKIFWVMVSWTHNLFPTNFHD